MNASATAVLEEYPDIVFSYGFSDEYNFVFKKKTKFYQRRASKMLSLVVSFFSCVYVKKWKEFFPEKVMKYAPCFCGRVIPCATIEVLQEYLAWRQNECHVNNLYTTSFWTLVSCMKTECEAQKILQEEAIIKYNKDGTPIRRLRRKAKAVHSDNIAGKCFRTGLPNLLRELGAFTEDITKINPDYIRSFLFKSEIPVELPNKVESRTKLLV